MLIEGPSSAGGKHMAYRTGLLCIVLLLAGSLPAPAALSAAAGSPVARVELTRREPLAGGMTFGTTGAYEKLVGTVHMEADPADSHNAPIQDLDRVPRNGRGMVEYSADVYILKPVDMSKGNGKILFQVINRGNKGVLATFDDAPGSNDPTTPADVGNGFVLREGYTLVFVGWESDVLAGANRMTVALPTATLNGAEITGPLTERYDVAHQIPTGGSVSLPLSGSPSSDSYETASLDTSSATFTARDYPTAPEREIPSDRWAFATCQRDEQSGQAVNVSPSRKDICLFDGFDPNQLYQLTYTARNPKPLALGFAVTRDLLSFLRSGATDASGAPNPLGSSISHVYCWGPSQDGRYLRTFLYTGFNEDLQGRKVCDGMLVHLAGAQGLDLMSRFSNIDNASQWAAPGVYPRDLFPFSYGMTTDPVSGRTDGILKRPATDPLVIQLDTENEYFQSYASLVTHDGLGNPLDLPSGVRYYFMSDAQHTSGSPSTKGICDQPTNPLNYNPFMRASLVALDRWVTTGAAAPPSQYPRADDGTAVSPQQWRDTYPRIPGVQLGVPNELSIRDYGPGVTPAGGIITTSPGMELTGSSYTILVPRTDPDGLDLAGLRRPDDVQTPIATLNGWNVRGSGFRAGDLCGLNGQYVPFEATEVERRAMGDPRPSLEERYPSHEDYVGRVAIAAMDMADNGYLLAEDVDRILSAAADTPVP
jgi:Alpha/beta hydrolase domain